jgi:gamma-glutamyltranspeptidase/glutathione hydrolase
MRPLRSCCLLGALLMAGLSAEAGDRITGEAFATRSPVLARHGMVATSQPLAALIGLDVLKEGGSAVDAAIATNAALGLMEPTGCGVGGDLFVILWDAKAKQLVGLNGSGRSPRGLSHAELIRRLDDAGADTIPLRSGLAVSVPGCVDGWFTLHERYGRLPMERLLSPAIRYAREGFPMTQVIGEYWRRSRNAYAGFDEFMATYMPGGQPVAEGQVFRNPNLASTYEALIQGGRDAFYTGPLAEDLVEAVNAAGGAFALEDLADHRSEWVDPVSVSYRGHEVWELPPNGQGIAALQLLSLAEGWELDRDDALTWHRLLEAKKLVYEDRARFYADPEFAGSGWKHLLSTDYAAARRALVDDARASQELDAGDLPDRGDTVYLTVADGEGNVVSWIQSNYTGFGSGIVPSGRGFTLQNRGNLFHRDPDHANAYAPAKRPFHTIIPAMMTRDGLPVLSFGVMGGAMQPQGHAQVVMNMLDFGMNVQEAGDAARWRHDGSPEPTGGDMLDGGVVHLEAGVPDAVVGGLRERGHRVEIDPGGYGGYQAIWIDDILDGGDAAKGGGRVYRGASESRKDGLAVGW